MIDDVTALNELHVVDFTGRLCPFKAVLVGELSTFGHRLIATLNKRILRQLRVVSKTNETLL